MKFSTFAAPFVRPFLPPVAEDVAKPSPATAKSPDKLLLDSICEKDRHRRERGEPMSEAAKFLRAGWAKREKAAAQTPPAPAVKAEGPPCPVKPAPISTPMTRAVVRVAAANAEIEKMEAELAAGPCNAERWAIAEKMAAAHERLETFADFPADEIEALLALPVSPAERGALAERLAALT